ncbi:NAD-dependent epimerase/dehydratase family protein [Kineococcus gynurae]|uniref:NAD-dependent epimerase/dehydratase family protein n=1 Tax=Kineococcus gynurae TaxID=452979 RepID=A0ABV5LX21_9ACTN
MSERVVVTGAAGKLGRAVVQDLSEHGFSVLALDRVRPQGWAGDFLQVDLTDQAQVVEVLAARTDERSTVPVDAVVHLAAVPAPGLLPNSATFTNNMPATWNVFTAARAAGIRRVVWASSETVLGLPFETPPPYAPVDEEYRPRPESTYSLVKTLEEELAHHLCRWEPGLSMTGLRFSNVLGPEDYPGFAAWQDDPSVRRWNLWGYVDSRDGAQAVRRGLARTEPGVEVCIVAAADTVMERPNAELLAAEFPGLELRREVGEHETLLSIDKARRLLGYDPQFSWRD